MAASRVVLPRSTSSYGLFDTYSDFIACVLGLAVFHHRFLDASFGPGFYKMVLNEPEGPRG